MSELEALADKINALSAPDRLRLAAGLMEQQSAQLAYDIANMVVTELGAALAIRAFDEKKVRP